ncbi:NRDE family protein [Parasediminibacterium sp. JCM 36343]|uniref:NRDE family protein n=1 Tax=Parasediminibacterium sp. JCM 36343 TaxID=3374279 RepID=UPI00397E057C
MCTVSYIPGGKQVIITSNRDEKTVRPPAIPPQKFETAFGSIVYPIDAKAGGTWFVVNEKGDTGVLLNGAFEKHIPKPSYRASRGSILPKLFNSGNILEALHGFDFTGIENCTLVLFIEGKLYECVWDGRDARINRLKENQAYIWSSVTLYDEVMIAARKAWFQKFLNANPYPTQAAVIDFHTHTGKGNSQYGLQMNRGNQMLTVSITSVAISENEAQLLYNDCMQKKQVKQILAREIHENV